MPRNITVIFDDGSRHVYKNAPDDITPDAVLQRAAKEFNKPVASLDGGRGNRFDEPQEKTLQPAYKSQKPVSLADTANLKAEDLPDFYSKTKDIPLTPPRKSKEEEGDAQMLMSLKDGTARFFAGLLKTGAQNEARRGKGELSGFEMASFGGIAGDPSSQMMLIGEDFRQGRKAEESHLTDEEFHAKQVAQYQKSVGEADSVANKYRTPDENGDFYDPELNSFSFDKTAENYRNNNPVVGTLKTADQIITAGMEALAGSAPYMLNAPVTAMSIAGDTTETRRANSGSALPSGGDALVGLGVGLSVGALERVLPKFITRSGAKTADEQQKAFDAIKDGAVKYAAANTSKEAAKAGGMEFAAEFSQNVIQYLGEKVGTDAAIDFSEMLQQSAEQGVVGAGAGALAGAPSGAVRSGADIVDAKRSGYQVTPESIQATKGLSQSLNRRDLVDKPANNETLPEYSLVDDLPPEKPIVKSAGDPTNPDDRFKFELDEESFISNISNALNTRKIPVTDAAITESQSLRDISLSDDLSFAEKARLAGKAQGINPINPDLEILPKAVNQLPDKVDYEAQRVAADSPIGKSFNDGELNLSKGKPVQGFADLIKHRRDAKDAERFNEQQKAKLETPVKTGYPQANFDPEEDAGLMGETKRLVAQSQYEPAPKESQSAQDLQDVYPPETKRKISKADARVDAPLPSGISDARLARPEYRSQLERAAAELVKGGNVSFIRDKNDRIIGRTKSINPDWFKSANDNPETSMSVVQAKSAIQKALAGEKLGVREARLVGAALDSISSERGQYAAELIAQRQSAKESRQAAYDSWRKETNVPDDAEFASMVAPEYPGETYSEQDYEIDLDYDDRSTSELVDHAIEMGASWKDVDAALELDDIDQQSKTLTNLIWSARNEHRQQAGTKQREASAQSRPREGAPTSDGLAEEAPDTPRATEAGSGITETNETKPSPSAGVFVSSEPEIIDSESSEIDQLKARIVGKDQEEKLLEFLLDVIDGGTDTMNDGGWPHESRKPAIELSKRIQSAIDSGDYSNIMDDAYQTLREMLKNDDFTEFPELFAIEKQLSHYGHLTSDSGSTKNTSKPKTKISSPKKKDQNDSLIKKVPPKILKGLQVDYPVFNEKTKRYENQKVSAKDALKSVNEDIAAFESLLNCVRG